MSFVLSLAFLGVYLAGIMLAVLGPDERTAKTEKTAKSEG